jgi:hypothetical protein
MKHILKTFYFQQFLYITVFTFLLLQCFWGQFDDKLCIIRGHKTILHESLSHCLVVHLGVL